MHRPSVAPTSKLRHHLPPAQGNSAQAVVIMVEASRLAMREPVMSIPVIKSSKFDFDLR